MGPSILVVYSSLGVWFGAARFNRPEMAGTRALELFDHGNRFIMINIIPVRRRQAFSPVSFRILVWISSHVLSINLFVFTLQQLVMNGVNRMLVFDFMALHLAQLVWIQPGWFIISGTWNANWSIRNRVDIDKCLQIDRLSSQICYIDVRTLPR